MLLLIKWICAHLIGDFLLQSKGLVLHKKRLKARSWFLYIHSLLHGVLIYLFTAQWDNWLVPLCVAVSHFFIDWWKLNRPEKLWSFVTDQLLHIGVLVALWFATQSTPAFTQALLQRGWNEPRLWTILMGYLLLMWPLSFLIGLATQRWRNEIAQQFEHHRNSLADAGKWIGIFERLLVYTFIITGQLAGIGFLITAKSILRFNETKKESGRKEAEYILIGTLMSFAYAIITGIIVTEILKRL